MMRATQIAPAGTWAADQEKDWVLLDFDRRHRRRVTLPTESGAEILLDLRDTVRMRDGDGLMLEGGGIIRVAARPEQLIEITAPSQILTRIAWHLGNRHLPVQFLDGHMRIRFDHVIADMIAGLGGTAHEIMAAFDPEPGAYAGGHAHHAHDHHHHDHD